MNVYSLSNITKAYGEKTVLNIHSLELAKGKIYALLGANGAGKTTLLNILAFLDTPSSGSIFFQSREAKFSERHLSLLRKKVVMISQYPIMFSTTVTKNIEFGLKIRNVQKKERARIIDESLDMVDMKHMKNERAQYLSGGETQRVAFARAMALSPEVILCDEPTSSVDLENQASIFNILSEINSQKKTTLVFTSHDKLQASSFSHHQIFLEHGRISDASYENLFTGIVTKKERHLYRCIIHNTLSLLIPSVRTGKIRFLIDPEKINVLETNQSEEGFNVIKGNVVQIAGENEKIRVVINTGVNITILIPRKTYTDSNRLFIVGNEIFIRVPPEAIQILG